jgi:hypothetical protein
VIITSAKKNKSTNKGMRFFASLYFEIITGILLIIKGPSFKKYLKLDIITLR